MSRRLVVLAEGAPVCCGNGVWSGDPSEPPQCCEQPDYPTEQVEPTAADLVAWLREHPAVAVEVRRTLPVADPWEKDGAWWQRDSGVDDAAALIFEPEPGRWSWTAYLDLEPDARDVSGHAWTLDDAKAAADAALVAAGWVLA